MKSNIYSLIALLTFVGGIAVEANLNAGCKDGSCGLKKKQKQQQQIRQQNPQTKVAATCCKNGRCLIRK